MTISAVRSPRSRASTAALRLVKQMACSVSMRPVICARVPVDVARDPPSDQPAQRHRCHEDRQHRGTGGGVRVRCLPPEGRALTRVVVHHRFRPAVHGVELGQHGAIQHVRRVPGPVGMAEGQKPPVRLKVAGPVRLHGLQVAPILAAVHQGVVPGECGVHVLMQQTQSRLRAGHVLRVRDHEGDEGVELENAEARGGVEHLAADNIPGDGGGGDAPGGRVHARHARQGDARDGGGQQQAEAEAEGQFAAHLEVAKPKHENFFRGVTFCLAGRP